MGDAGNKWIADALISDIVGCTSSDFILGCIGIMVGVNGGYAAFLVMI